MKTKLLIFLICLGCSQKRSAKLSNGQKTSLISDISLDAAPNDSTLSANFIKKSFPTWFDYHLSNNPKFEVDSFQIQNSTPLNRQSTEYSFTPDFLKAYKNVLSYSPDSSMILDLFSNQVELKKQADGKYGGLYTISTEAFLWEPSNERKNILNIKDDTDSFHDSFWLNDRTVTIIGTTKIDRPSDFSRVYKIWTLDFEQRKLTTYINPVSCENYYVEEYIRQIRLSEYNTYLDEM